MIFLLRSEKRSEVRFGVVRGVIVIPLGIIGIRMLFGREDRNTTGWTAYFGIDCTNPITDRNSATSPELTDQMSFHADVW